MMPGTLYVVATPIGNLEDMTYRAVRMLGEADLIACEDTRQTRKLLDHYGIQKPAISYHEHNETERTAELLARLTGGASIALVSDAGMPLVSDPGYRLVQAAVESGHHGLADSRRFGRHDRAGRIGAAHRRVPLRRIPAAQARAAAATRWKALAEEQATLIFYEAPHRILEALEAVEEASGPAPRGGGAGTDQDARGVPARHGRRSPRATGGARCGEGRDHAADRQGHGAAARRYARLSKRSRRWSAPACRAWMRSSRWRAAAGCRRGKCMTQCC